MISNNQKVNNFLSDVENTLPDRYKIVGEIRGIFLENNPDITEEIKYGGITFNLLGELIGGVFLSKKHISIEFSNGASFQDPDKHLEGKGKLRRHLKIIKSEDISNKNCGFYIEQATN